MCIKELIVIIVGRTALGNNLAYGVNLINFQIKQTSPRKFISALQVVCAKKNGVNEGQVIKSRIIIYHYQLRLDFQ